MSPVRDSDPIEDARDWCDAAQHVARMSGPELLLLAVGMTQAHPLARVVREGLKREGPAIDRAARLRAIAARVAAETRGPVTPRPLTAAPNGRRGRPRQLIRDKTTGEILEGMAAARVADMTPAEVAEAEQPTGTQRDLFADGRAA